GRMSGKAGAKGRSSSANGPSPRRLLDALREITGRITATRDVDEVLSSITRGLVELGGASLARIWLLTTDAAACPVCSAAEQSGVPSEKRDAVEPMLHLRSSAGLHTNLAGRYHRVSLGERKIGQIAATRQPVCTNDVLHDERIADKAWVERNDLRGFAGYPL